MLRERLSETGTRRQSRADRGQVAERSRAASNASGRRLLNRINGYRYGSSP